MTTGKHVLGSLLLLLLAAGTAAGQWISFTEDPGRLVAGSPNLQVPNQDEVDMAAGDVDQDGDPDLVVVRKLPFSNPGARQHVLLMNEGGTLVDRTSLLCPDFLTNHSNARDVALTDLDGDGWLDMVVANTFDEEPEPYMNLASSQGVWQGFQKDPSRFPVLTQGSTGPMFCAVAHGDIDQDNDVDLYFVDYDNTLEDVLLVNDGTGSFTNETDARLTAAMKESSFGTSCQIRDVNGDGWQDIVKLTTLSSPVELRVLYNDGAGAFSVMQDMPTTSPYMFDCDDYDRDGDMDLYVVQDGQDQYILNEGTQAGGTISVSSHTLSGSPATTGFGGNVTTGDLDQDGYTDIVVSDVDIDIPGCSRRSAFLRNQGAGSWPLFKDRYGVQTAWSTNGTYDTAILDIDGDGRLDVVAGTCNGVRVFMGVPELSLQVTTDNAGSLDLHIRNGAPGTQAYTLVSFNPVPPGSGPMLGLSADAFALLVSLGQSPPVNAPLAADGSYSFQLPTASMPTGLQVQARALNLPSSPQLSWVVTTTF